MSNPENLIPQAHVITVEEASKGGRASGEARRRKKRIAELVPTMLNQPLQGDAKKEVSRLFPDLDDETTMAASIVMGQISSARKGNTRAFRSLMELAQQEEAREDKEQLFELSPLDFTIDCIEPYRTLHAVYDGKLELDDMVFRGGRGGTKSTFGAELAFETIKQDRYANVVYGRRFSVDLRDTVFAQFIQIITRKNDLDSWEITKSPMRCTYKPHGTSVYFYGFDNAEQLKSFAPTIGYIKLLIFEEADEMLGDSQMDSAAQTFLRANGFEGVAQLRLKIFNPPASRQNFMNQWCSEMIDDPSTRIFDFSYKHVPEEWLGEAFLRRAKWFEEHRPDYYRNVYLGEVTGTGGELFANVVEEKISDELVEKLERQGRVYQGIDFGYEHPMVFVRVAYDPEKDIVYPLFEHVRYQSRLSEFLEPLEKHDDYRFGETIADSAEPDRIADMLERGWDVVKSVKRWSGNRGRAYSWEWLRNRSKIVVDISRTPHLAKELRSLEFEKLKSGSFSSRIPDVGEDAVMATIYALNRVIRATE